MLSLHVYLPAPPPLLLRRADICRDANGEWQPKAGLSASDLEKFNEAKTKYNDLQKNFGANSPARIIATALTGAAGGNVAGNLTGLVQGVAVNVLQSLAVNQVKHIADSLYDANGNPTAGSEAVRAALQGLTACAGGAANGTGSCSSAGAGASASVVINYLLTEFLDLHPKDAQGNPIERTLEDQQARTNVVTTLIGAIAAGAGLDAGSATNAAQIETENNDQGKYKPCTNGGPDCIGKDEFLAKDDIKPYVDAGVIDPEDAWRCATSNQQCPSGKELLIEKLEKSFPDIGEQLANLSDAELVARYTDLENKKLAAFLEVKNYLPYLETHPELFATLSPEQKAVYVLAYQYREENKLKAL